MIQDVAVEPTIRRGGFADRIADAIRSAEGDLEELYHDVAFCVETKGVMVGADTNDDGSGTVLLKVDDAASFTDLVNHFGKNVTILVFRD